MAVDKLVDSTQLNADLTSVANAIRAKGGTSASLAFPDGFVDAIGDIETGGGVTVSPLSVTANGTYTAPSGEAYSPVTVNVPTGGGVASNVVTGTFTGTTTGAAMDVPLDYSGNGYPIALMIYPSEGAYNANGTFYNLIQRYATWFYYSVKCYPDLIPLYTDGNDNDLASIINRYKGSSSNSKIMSNSISANEAIYDNNSSSEGPYTIVKIKSPQIMSVFIASTSNGFAANIEYTYHIIYSL